MMMLENISLYIPHVFPNFDKEYMTECFKNIGEISRIDFVAKQDRNGKDFNAVYIHFNKWYTNKKATEFHKHVLDESEDTRFYHDNNWYWIVLPNTAKKQVSGQRKTRIDLGNCNSISTTREKGNNNNNDNNDFNDVIDFEAQIEAEMDELEALMNEEDAHIVSIDSRYIKAIEEENAMMNIEIARLRSIVMRMGLGVV